MLKKGDTVRFRAVTKTFSLKYWAMDESAGFVKFIRRLNGLLAEVVQIKYEDEDEQPYVDLVFQDGEQLDAVSSRHVELVDQNIRVLKQLKAA